MSGDDKDKTTGEDGGKTLTLKRASGPATVTQQRGRGRGATVVVEKRRRTPPPGLRTPSSDGGKSAPAADGTAEAAKPAARPTGTGKGRSKAGGLILRALTDEEKEARARAIDNARAREIEERRQAEADARRKAEEDARLAREREDSERRKAEEDIRRKAEDDARRRAEQEAARRDGPAPAAGAAAPSGETRRPAPAALTPRPGRSESEDEDGGRARSKPGRRGAPVRPAPRRTGPGPGGARRGERVDVRTALTDTERVRSDAAWRRKIAKQKMGGARQDEAPAPPREVTIPDAITIADLANRMARKGVDVVRVLMKQGLMLTINDTIDADTAQLVAEEFGHTVKRVSESDVLEGLSAPDDADETKRPRPPVVTIMGHVDHGKTSLLDALREANVVAGEAGGITQHIGAYQVTAPSGARITFLDTPGHAAFTAMRARGARVTDIVVLVVAADDSVKPQTVEAIAHAKAAEVPLIVAVNKVDKPDANPQRVKTDLLNHDIQVEDMGGETLCIEVSALKKTGLDKLEEAILLQAEVLDLRANPDRPAEGAIVEAKLDKGRGPVGTVLVERGTLRKGDIVVAGAVWGRVRALIDDRGQEVEAAGPSAPVEVLGLDSVPEAGDELVVVESEARAREVADFRQRKLREMRTAQTPRASLDQLLKQREEGEKKLLPLVIKADVQGSVEAIAAALEKLANEEVGVQILQATVGGITESDVILARASGAAIFGFNVRANAMARERAKRDGVDIRYYSIIYNVIDDVKAALSGMLAPTVQETFIGYAEILEVFNITKVGKVAGCRVTEGVVKRGAKVRLLRDDVVIHEGELSQLKRFKDDVKEVTSGMECGMSFANYHDLQPGDMIECFEVQEVARAI